MKESELLTELKTLAEQLGFRVWRVHQTRRKPTEHIDKGFSDMICVGHGTIIFVETKVGHNKLSVDQEEFRDCVVASGGQYWCIKSTDEFFMLGKMKGWWR